MQVSSALWSEARGKSFEEGGALMVRWQQVGMAVGHLAARLGQYSNFCILRVGVA